MEPPRDEGTPAGVLDAGAATPAVGRRALWGGLDQAVYGLTNLVLSLMVATSVSQEEFGAFGAVLIVHTITNGGIEGMVAEVFTVTYSTAAEGPRRRALADAAGCAIGLGLLVALAAVGGAVLTDGEVARVLPAFALVVPLFYLQDLWRFALFALGRPRAAVFNDLVWAGVQAVAIVAVRASGDPSVRAYVLAWGAGAAAGAVVGLAQLRVRPRPLATVSWLREHRGLGGRFAGEFLVLYGSAQVAMAAVGITGGLTELARMRAGQVVFTPLQGALNAVRISVTSIAVDLRERRVGQLGRFATRLALGLGALAVLVAVMALALPDDLGEALLGDSWDGAKAVLLPLAAMNVAFAAALGPLTLLRATRDARRSFRARLATAVLVAGLGGAGALTGDAPGAAWGIAVAAWLGLVVITVQARGSLADASRTPNPA